MAKIITGLLCVFGLTFFCYAGGAAPKRHKKPETFQFHYIASAGKVADLLRNAPKMSFRYLNSVSQLPAAVLQHCAGGKMAEPGKKWQVTDVIMDASLPNKRLVWAVNFKDYYLLHYENGGFGYNCSIVLLKYDKAGGVNVLMDAMTWEPVKDYYRVLLLLNENKLIDACASNFSGCMTGSAIRP